jgi:adenine-specific DNA-methyltransferase
MAKIEVTPETAPVDGAGTEPAKIEVTRTELVWPGKYDENGKHRGVERITLPFQVIERVNESRATREARAERALTLFDTWKGDEGETFEEGWRNKLIWGDNKVVMSSLLEQFAGSIDLIYIDPPFGRGSDFDYSVEIGDEKEQLFKERSVIEEKAYRDTWNAGYDSYLPMLYERLLLLRELLAPTGSIFVHLDAHAGPYVKVMLDEVFGRDNFRNEIAWYYYNKMHDSRKRLLPKAFDQILYYVKSKDARFVYVPLEEQRATPVKQLKRVKVGGVMKNARDEFGRVIYQDKTTRTVDNVWRIRCLQPANKEEWVNFETQKPVDLLQRVIELASRPGDLVLDAFCGSGSALVASETLERRWIGIDIGRYPIHLTRKRLLDIKHCRPFEVLNLGKYERRYWQVATFGEDLDDDGVISLYEYVAFILKLYGAAPATGLQHIHGKLGAAFVHVGAVDAPVTIDEVAACVAECAALKATELHVLGWEWEMGMNDLVSEEAKRRGVKVVLRQIPREVMDEQAAAKGDIQFFELAYLEASVEPTDKANAREFTVVLDHFVIPNPELVPDDILEKISKWTDYVDYWAVDWDFRGDTFMQSWVTYRTRKNRKLQLRSDPHVYAEPGEYAAMVKVIDVFGNDTSKILRLTVT